MYLIPMKFSCFFKEDHLVVVTFRCIDGTRGNDKDFFFEISKAGGQENIVIKATMIVCEIAMAGVC